MYGQEEKLNLIANSLEESLNILTSLHISMENKVNT